jgi:hypothetical protein
VQQTLALESHGRQRNSQAACPLDDVEAKVFGRVGRRVRELRLILADGGLVLRGHARTFYVKQLAQHAVMEVTSMPIVANEIEVC